MTESADGLAAFLTERLDEAEAIARAASSDAAPGGDTWHQADPDRRPGLIRDQHGGVVVYDEGSPIEVQAEHIAANDPARTLRGIAAKRAILAEHQASDHEHDGRRICLRCVNPSDLAAAGPFRWQVPYPCPTVRQLGTEWDDHPAYLPEWSPEPVTAP